MHLPACYIESECRCVRRTRFLGANNSSYQQQVIITYATTRAVQMTQKRKERKKANTRGKKFRVRKYTRMRVYTGSHGCKLMRNWRTAFDCTLRVYKVIFIVRLCKAKRTGRISIYKTKVFMMCTINTRAYRVLDVYCYTQYNRVHAYLNSRVLYTRLKSFPLWLAHSLSRVRSFEERLASNKYETQRVRTYACATTHCKQAMYRGTADISCRESFRDIVVGGGRKMNENQPDTLSTRARKNLAKIRFKQRLPTVR